MKTKEELEAIKEKVETVSKNLVELSNEELEQIIGGESGPRINPIPCPYGRPKIGVECAKSHCPRLVLVGNNKLMCSKTFTVFHQ